MARCDDCIHYDVCLKLVYSRIIFCGDNADNRCKMFKSTADVAPRAEWISVEERLPDVCGMPVLMVAENEYGQTSVVKGFTGYTCPIDFCTNEIEYYGIWNAWKVTHWMPLPEPPKGEKHDPDPA